MLLWTSRASSDPRTKKSQRSSSKPMPETRSRFIKERKKIASMQKALAVLDIKSVESNFNLAEQAPLVGAVCLVKSHVFNESSFVDDFLCDRLLPRKSRLGHNQLRRTSGLGIDAFRSLKAALSFPAPCGNHRTFRSFRLFPLALSCARRDRLRCFPLCHRASRQARLRTLDDRAFLSRHRTPRRCHVVRVARTLHASAFLQRVQFWR